MRPLSALPLLLLLGAGPPETRPPEVRRGDHVQPCARAGAVTVQVEAEALEDGRVGDLIRVRNLHSGRAQKGRVSRAGQVEVVN